MDRVIILAVEFAEVLGYRMCYPNVFRHGESDSGFVSDFVFHGSPSFFYWAA
jgi:hypothetical protein